MNEFEVAVFWAVIFSCLAQIFAGVGKGAIALFAKAEDRFEHGASGLLMAASFALFAFFVAKGLGEALVALRLIGVAP